MILRVRPTVMISSTIGELAVERQEIADELDGAGLADGWLFELHATAAGQPAESRYLDIARGCDLYVIIIAAQGSEATEAEYHAAYGDNPRKILPFFVETGTEATQAIRALIESRHVRVHCQDRADLAPAVVEAITDQVRSGEIVRLPLCDALHERLSRAEQVVGAGIPLAFVPQLVSNPRQASIPPTQEHILATALPAREHRIALEGIGGAGKTYGALAMLCHANRRGRLPVVVSPSPSNLSVSKLIIAAFEAVRFFPGEALLHQLARDGQLAVLVDGADSLASDERRVLLNSLDEFARQFPRTLVICCLRRVFPEELESFARFAPEPLSDSQVADMFHAVNAPQIRSFPTQVADLARWPLWAWALLHLGPGVQTGLLLLQELLALRIRRSGAYPPIEAEMLTDAAAAIAFHAWPQPSMPTSDALTTVVDWAETPAVGARYATPPAETVIHRLSSTGVVHLTPDVVFAHPLFATYLGARHAASSGQITDRMAADPEFSMFVAALLDESQADDKLRLLTRHGAVGQARYLRLVPEHPRDPLPTDSAVFGEAVKALSGTAAESIVTETWTAWRMAEESAALGPEAIAQWMLSGEVNFLPGHGFRRRSPIDLAAIESLARFKDHVTQQQPDGSRFDRLKDKEMRQFRKRPRAELEDLIIQAVVDWRREWREQASAMKLSMLPEVAIGEGDPHVTVYEEWPDPGLHIEWGSTAAVTWVQPEGDRRPWSYQPLSNFLDPGRNARVYEGLVERAERALGCRFSSQAWTRPEHVAAWAW